MNFFSPNAAFSLFDIFTLLGGLALFLYGMRSMSSGLEALAGGRLEGLLKKMTSNPIKSLALGAGITIAIQSSSAMTVMLVGLVNSGIMQLPQTVGVIMGSNVGTTLTAWITSLSGIKSDSFFMSLLKPSAFSPILALVGVLLLMAAKNDRRRSVGSILIGFAVLMFGMDFMSGAMEGLATVPGFAETLTAFNNPLLGVLTGAVLTGIIQSSSASVAILQGLAGTGGVTFAMAFPIIMGQNIGTTVTALISAIGVNRNAKRVAVIHAFFNILGTAIFLVVYGTLCLMAKPLFLDLPIDGFGIAASHTVFNVVTTLLLLPFSRFLVRLAQALIKDKPAPRVEKQVCFPDGRLLAAPSIAVGECNARTAKRAKLAEKKDGFVTDEGYRVGSLFVSPARHTVLVDGVALSLSLKEFKLLCLLVEKQGAVADRDEILTAIWGYAFDGESRTVDVHIRNLRQKLGTAGAMIRTVKGIGYKLTEK